MPTYGTFGECFTFRFQGRENVREENVQGEYVRGGDISSGECSTLPQQIYHPVTTITYRTYQEES